jgi:hypothetical protein
MTVQNAVAGLSTRSSEVVKAIMPRIQDAMAERTRQDNPNIDLSTAENCLIRKELIEMYQESIRRGDLAARVGDNPRFKPKELTDTMSAFFVSTWLFRRS